jgi:trk system potassium uptake protein TrkH
MLFFESFSGLTTTGATVLSGLDQMPKAILFYHQMLQWLGGMGIIVLALAILPILGVGAVQLYRAETPGPMKDRMKPRIAETAKTLWLIYVILTIVCAIFLWLGGMSLFDAICHSFSTISIGGFSTHDASIGYFESSTINIIVACFLLISGCNYGLHFLFLNSGRFHVYFNDPEFLVFIGIQAILVVICVATLSLLSDTDINSTHVVEKAFFHVVSMATTAGFFTDEISKWPNFLPVLMLFSAFVGGMAGSMGGGLKVIRTLLLFKQGSRELKRLVHHNAVYTIKLGKKVLPERVVDAVWGFFSAYLLVFLASMLAITATGIDNFSAFTAVSATLNNLGLDIASDNFSSMNNIAKWVLVITMLFGRLEVFTLLVLFTPAFWRE